MYNSSATRQLCSHFPSWDNAQLQIQSSQLSVIAGQMSRESVLGLVDLVARGTSVVDACVDVLVPDVDAERGLAAQDLGAHAAEDALGYHVALFVDELFDLSLDADRVGCKVEGLVGICKGQKSCREHFEPGWQNPKLSQPLTLSCYLYNFEPGRKLLNADYLTEHTSRFNFKPGWQTPKWRLIYSTRFVIQGTLSKCNSWNY